MHAVKAADAIPAAVIAAARPTFALTTHAVAEAIANSAARTAAGQVNGDSTQLASAAK
jgi:hypothetical protein